MSLNVTDNILVKAVPRFEKKFSNPVQAEYIFSYHITIENSGSESVQLLSRHWYIFDSSSEYSEVKGEGVIGLQPIIHPGLSHEYDSYCSLSTEMGMMWGTYLMKKLESDTLFEVKIPEFQMIAPYRLN
jgi:ApaG protein